MKLFTETKTGQINEEIISSLSTRSTFEQSIVIISPRRNVLSDISSHLAMHNLKKIVEYEGDFFSLYSDVVSGNPLAVIVDIVDVDEIDKLKEKITMLIPIQTRVFIVGDSDSIAFSQKLTRTAGVPYLHIDSQLAVLAGLLLDKNPPVAYRSTVIISVLGCKGGAGTSRIAGQLFQAVGKLSTIPVLLIQGTSGSLDLDLRMKKALPHDGSFYQITSSQFACIEPHNNVWNYCDPRYKKFNLVLMDQMLHDQPSEQYEKVITHSHTVILVITRELASLRVAKKVLNENRRIMQNRKEQGVRTIICLNENHPPQSGELKNTDIEEYLGCDIDVNSIWEASGKERSFSTDSPIYHLALLLLGKSRDAMLPRNRMMVLLDNLFHRLKIFF